MNRERSYGFMAYCTLGLLCVMYLLCQTAIWLETSSYDPLQKIFNGSYILLTPKINDVLFQQTLKGD